MLDAAGPRSKDWRAGPRLLGQNVLAEAVIGLARLAAEPEDEFLARTEKVLAEVLQARVMILARSGAKGRLVRESPSFFAGQLERARPGVSNQAGIERLADGTISITIRPGRLIVLLDFGPRPPADDFLIGLTAALDLTLLVQDQRAAARQAFREVFALQQVSTQILSVRDIDQVLVSVTQTALSLLSADIAGVFLLDGEDLAMRCCVGNRSVETARLRMQAGKGLAGRVLETGAPVEVDNYVAAQEISKDFVSLARTENVRSALGAPLTVRGEVIGVLEVWRRRRSAFSEQEVRRLVAMANLAAIAIDNARLYESQLGTLRQLEASHASLGHQVEVLKQSNTIQRSLMQTLLDGQGLAAMVRTVASGTDCQAAIVSTTFQVLAAHPPNMASLPELALIKAQVSQQYTLAGAAPTRLRLSTEEWLVVEPIQAAGELFGYALLFGREEPGEMLQMVAGQLALSSALHLLEQRSADEARAEVRDEIVWDLIQGPADYRSAAARRANRMNIDLHRPLRLACFNLPQIEPQTTAAQGRIRGPDGLRREAREIVRAACAGRSGPDLVSVRRELIVAVVACAQPNEARALAADIIQQLDRLLPGTAVTCGLSRPRLSPLEYHKAYDEALIALRAAVRLGGSRVTLFDDLGVVRLLLTPNDEPEALRTFVGEVIGPVLDYDRKRGTSLIDSLRAYLRADCNLKQAAKKLFVHHKTMRYRLDRIQELTGLDLHVHEDRFHVDLALRILDAAQIRSDP